jgi:hypothetical protein
MEAIELLYGIAAPSGNPARSGDPQELDILTGPRPTGQKKARAEGRLAGMSYIVGRQADGWRSPVQDGRGQKYYVPPQAGQRQHSRARLPTKLEAQTYLATVDVPSRQIGPHRPERRQNPDRQAQRCRQDQAWS